MNGILLEAGSKYSYLVDKGHPALVQPTPAIKLRSCLMTRVSIKHIYRYLIIHGTKI